MANKLAGQRSKFAKARAIYYQTSDETVRMRQAALMAEVIVDAPMNDFTREQVTQEADVPDVVDELIRSGQLKQMARSDDPTDEKLEETLRELVDISDVKRVREGSEFVYAYGYPCAPDRLKIGRASGDVIARIASQIGTSTPDRPKLWFQIATHDAIALERALHACLRLSDRQIKGGGAEWFRITSDELNRLYQHVSTTDWREKG